jgi:hypothetical protein
VFHHLICIFGATMIENNHVTFYQFAIFNKWEEVDAPQEPIQIKHHWSNNCVNAECLWQSLLHLVMGLLTLLLASKVKI